MCSPRIDIPQDVDVVTRVHRIIGLRTLCEMRYTGRFHIGCFELRDDMYKVKKREIIRFTVIRFFFVNTDERDEREILYKGNRTFLFIV